MSLVGTRPILQDELRQYELHHRARIAIKGIQLFELLRNELVVVEKGMDEAIRGNRSLIKPWSVSERADEFWNLYDKKGIDTDLWSLSWIHFSGVTMQTVYQKYQERGGRPVFRPDNFTDFQSLHQSLFDLAASDDYIRDMRINSGLNELLVFLMNESWHPAEHPDRVQKKQNLLPVRNYLETHYTEKIVLDELADRFFIRVMKRGQTL